MSKYMSRLGEAIDAPIPTRRADVLAALQAARQRVPDIPRAAPIDLPPANASQVAPSPAAVAVTATPLKLDETLVGRRVQALWCDPDDEDATPEWYWCTIVTFRPGRRVKYNYIMHFDDGTAEKIALPDEEGTIEIRDDVVEMCTCDRCCCAGSEGVKLPISDTSH